MIEILIRSDSRYPLNRKNLRQKIVFELEQWRIKSPMEVSVMIVGSRKMKALNKHYRQLNQPTNVLSFPLEEQNSSVANPSQPPHPSSVGFAYPQDGKLYLGDIVICYPVARHQAAEYQMFVEEWIGDLAVHGLKHLLGEHHE